MDSGRQDTQPPSAAVEHAHDPAESTPPQGGLIGHLRAALAGVLMGMANLIPGVSGGTMILAMGLYEEFIDSVADITAFRFSLRRIAFLGIVGAFAIAAIFGLAAVILYLLFYFPAAMYALFIGLTLGGAPLLARSLKPVRLDAVIAVAVGFLLMLGTFLLKGGQGLPHGAAIDFLSGVVGATTMVLPGVSGSYMLLVMDQYERVVGAVKDRNLQIIATVGVGAVLGVIGLSNLLKYLLHHYHRPTIGVLLGIVLGSVVGLWPFNQRPEEDALEQRTLQELHDYAAGHRIPGADLIVDHPALVAHILEHWDDRLSNDYNAATVTRAIILTLVGFAVTYGLSHLGERPRKPEPTAAPLAASPPG